LKGSASGGNGLNDRTDLGELAEKIKKNQFNLRLLTKKPVTVRALGAEVLAA
jgi:hypothetical protein